jgi:hypothetical protein
LSFSKRFCDVDPSQCLEGVYVFEAEITALDANSFPAEYLYKVTGNFIDSTTLVKIPFSMDTLSGSLTLDIDGQYKTNETALSSRYDSETNSLKWPISAEVSGTYAVAINATSIDNKVTVAQTISKDILLPNVSLAATVYLEEFYTAMTADPLVQLDARSFQLNLRIEAYKTADNTPVTEKLTKTLRWSSSTLDASGNVVDVTDYYSSQNAVVVDGENPFIVNVKIPGEFLKSVTFIFVGTATTEDGLSASTCYKYLVLNPEESTDQKK